MIINVENIKSTCRLEAYKYLKFAEENDLALTQTKNYFKTLSLQERKKEYLRVAHQLLEIADGRRGILARVFTKLPTRMLRYNFWVAFKTKKKTPYIISLAGCGAKIGGFIHKRGIKPTVCLEIAKDLSAEVVTETYRKADYNYGD